MNDRIRAIVGSVTASGPVTNHPRLYCFVTGPCIPPSAISMPLVPTPPIGMEFDTSFPQVIERCLQANPASHDGAIILLRPNFESNYVVAGWSYRLCSQNQVPSAAPNRGSAYNSCLAMAQEPTVDLVVLTSLHGEEWFIRSSK